ncbi:hypothetical protein [Pseudoalteromonas sp. Of11M-6]|uniref:hypothetical protein n=1 Tax=Pseudoalteromonas sp. Of11M-6 TaxID=2917754 RepID=UPI001EF44E08|nr:hypothetical protein [Pseudoalteromonas sp. Of11M-6]MCG7556075.1 hypothetical protein [Pseudoalteromonas sp. Of11M-6]
MKYFIVVSMLLVTACSSEPTDESIKEYISRVDCSNLKLDGEHEKLVKKVQQYCESQKIRKFTVKKSKPQEW